MTIELDGPLVLPAPTQDTNGIVHYTLRYLFDGGSSQVRYWAVNGKCTPPSTTEGTGKKICQSIETITSVSSILISRVIALPISVAPSQFIIGAQLTSDQTNPYKNQISNTIRKITIK